MNHYPPQYPTHEMFHEAFRNNLGLFHVADDTYSYLKNTHPTLTSFEGVAILAYLLGSLTENEMTQAAIRGMSMSHQLQMMGAVIEFIDCVVNSARNVRFSELAAQHAANEDVMNVPLPETEEIIRSVLDHLNRSQGSDAKDA